MRRLAVLFVPCILALTLVGCSSHPTTSVIHAGTRTTLVGGWGSVVLPPGWHGTLVDYGDSQSPTGMREAALLNNQRYGARKAPPGVDVAFYIFRDSTSWKRELQSVARHFAQTAKGYTRPAVSSGDAQAFWSLRRARSELQIFIPGPSPALVLITQPAGHGDGPPEQSTVLKLLRPFSALRPQGG